MRANGSYLGATPTGPTTAVASGIWGLRDAERYNRDGEWPAAPGAPTGLAVDSTGDGTIDLSWTAPATGNVTDYVVEYTPSGGSATTVNVGSATTSYQITGLTNGTEYSVRVAASNAGLVGAYSTAVTGTPSAAVTDPDFANVVLLLHMDGSDGSTTFTDSSSYGRTATVYRNAALSNTQSKFGGTSGYFSGGTTGSGSSQRVDTITFPDSDDFNMGSSDWTIEAWVYVTSFAAQQEIWSHRDGSGGTPLHLLRLNTSGTVRAYFDGGTTDVTTSETLSGNTWHHIAIVRESAAVAVYIDGTAATLSGTNGTGAYGNPPGNVAIASGLGSAGINGWSSPFSGYIDDFRWTIGTARYTANFTPPTAAFPDS